MMRRSVLEVCARLAQPGLHNPALLPFRCSHDPRPTFAKAALCGSAPGSATRPMSPGNPLRHLASVVGGLWPTTKREAGWLLLVMAAVLAFAGLAREWMEGATRAFDRAVLLRLRNPADPGDPIGPNWLEEVARDVTSLGGNAILLALTLAVFGFLALTEKRAVAVIVAVSTGGGMA